MSENNETSATDIAVIGMACRFAGANNPSEFWQLLHEGREARTELSDTELQAAGVSKSLLSDPNYVKAGMFLHGMELFDAGFFGFSPLDAKIMDPQHRHFLECTWEALEDAAYDPTRYDGAIGVFAGSGHNAYLPYNLLSNPELVAQVGFFLLRHTGNDKDFLATRASYCFDLKGPSVNVQTACSTSLVAVHTAAQNLLNGECDMALAGGVTIEMPHRHGYLYKDTEILSRDGHCRPFDASAGGTVFGSGVGVLVLKRLDDAIADGDNIHAVIKASAVNNDGAGKISYLAPSVDGQAAAIHEALAIGGIEPQSVTYVECHGTGTPLGDPIEVAALTQAYGAENPRRQYCAIGSVKSNIGHTDTAAGAASLIKVILALKHRQLPATLHFRAPNEAIDFANSPFFVNAQLRPWSAPAPLRAGVSSLGVGGTNGHVIVEEAPARASSSTARARQLLLLSARTDTALTRSRNRFAQFFEEADVNIADAAFTLAVGRRSFKRRGFAVVNDGRDAVAVLDGSSHDRFIVADAAESPRKVAFMFAGGGAQYPNMGRELYDTEPVYRATVDECLRLLRDFVDFDVKSLLYPAAGAEAQAAHELQRPSRTLPALFITQYAQAQLWRSWGIEPSALIGHSMGENTAACVAGVIALRDALGLVALRGKLFETVGEGSMLSVELGEQELLPLLGSELSLGAVNAPMLTMASGPKAALTRLEYTLQQRDIGCRRIHIDVAAHSAMLEEILQPFGDYLRSLRLHAPTIPFISNVTGDWIKPAEAVDPAYWVRHLRQTVRFADGLARLLDGGSYALLEVGPGRTLVSLAGLHTAKRADQPLIASLRHPDDDTPDVEQMLGALGRLWQANVGIAWDKFYSEQTRHRVSLPTYAFDHARHWVEPGASLTQGDMSARAETLTRSLYQPVWQRTAPLVSATGELVAARVLVLAGSNAVARTAIEQLLGAGAEARVVEPGSSLLLSGERWRLRATVADDYVHLVEALRQSDWQPTHVLSLLPLDLVDGEYGPNQRALAFDSLFHLAQAAANEDWQPVRWLTVTAQAFQVGGESPNSPLAALALGPMRVLPHEFPSWRCALLDIDTNTQPATILRELSSTADDGLIAMRGNARFMQRYELRADSDSTGVATLSLRACGVYLITGGTGGLGVLAAATLVQAQPDITLVLAARRPLPERQYWDALIAQNAPEAATLSQLLQLEQSGARIVGRAVDIADETAVRELAAAVRREFGAVNGIIHTAGVIADSLLLTKDFADAERVLMPKLTGTLVLDRVFDARTLDFFVLYSSTSAFAGLPGQIDYAAANAFLDAFAHHRNARGANVIAINWPAWKQSGMAAKLAEGVRYLPAGRPVTHPLLDRCIAEQAEAATYATLFSVHDYWLLGEHRIKAGPALIPGSGFIELARAAFAEKMGNSPSIEMTDVVFELPFFVADNAHKALTVELSGDNFAISSDSFGEASRHAYGRVVTTTPMQQSIDVAAIQLRCARGIQTFDDASHHPFLDFGARWRVLKNVAYGVREALIRLDMPVEFRDELNAYGLHPAVLDMATAGAQIIVDGYAPHSELYVPIGYQRLQFNGRLPNTGFSHVVHRAADSGSAAHEMGDIQFDVTVCDDNGNVCLSVQGFTMRRIADVNSFRKALPIVSDDVNPSLKRTLELGINDEEGKAALLAILQRQLAPQTVVSAYRLDYLQHELLSLVLPKEQIPENVHDADADPDIAAIESLLQECPALETAVVRSFLDESEERRLVAFFVPNFEHFVTQGELRRFARDKLPAAQVPQHWIELDEIPRDAAGVIDRKGLFDPLAPKDHYLAPRTSIEKNLARIWQDALGVERVGLSDNFFDLGGHSLLSTRVIVQIYKKLGIRLDQATMVLHTLEQIAREISEKTGAVTDASPISENPMLDSIVPGTLPGEVKIDKKKGRLQSLLFGGKK